MSDNLTKHTLLLREGDFEFLRTYFPKKGASAMIRKVTSKLVDQLDKPVTDAELDKIDE